jgi:LacI family transcriptional regulator
MTANTGQGPTTDSTEPLTIKEIARLTGVSIGTVDRVLHHRGRVSAENVAKIQSLIEDRGYRPNLFASRLSAGETHTVGVVVPRAEQDFGYWKLIVEGMERAAQELQPLRLHVRFETFDRRSPESLAHAFRAVADADGLAVAPIHVHALRPLVEELPESTPLVFFDTDMECQRTRCFVGQDPWTGGAVAARLLGLAAGEGAALGVIRFDEDDEHLQLRSRAFAETGRAAGAEVHMLSQAMSAPLDVRLDEVRAFLEARAIRGLFVPNAAVAEYAATSPKHLGGYDLTPGNQTALEDGRADFLLSQRPQVMGHETVIRLGRALLFREELPRRIAMPLDIILKENLSGHLERTQ